MRHGAEFHYCRVEDIRDTTRASLRIVDLNPNCNMGAAEKKQTLNGKKVCMFNEFIRFITGFF